MITDLLEYCFDKVYLLDQNLTPTLSGLFRGLLFLAEYTRVIQSRSFRSSLSCTQADYRTDQSIRPLKFRPESIQPLTSTNNSTTLSIPDFCIQSLDLVTLQANQHIISNCHLPLLLAECNTVLRRIGYTRAAIVNICLEYKLA